jgi:hypothetical protein
VIRVLGAKIILQMAKNTDGWQSFILAAAMASGTIDHSMLSLQRKRIMVELRPCPRHSLCSMACLTIEGIIQLFVVRISGVVIVLSMAKHTI